jgi:hypothetical protein
MPQGTSTAPVSHLSALSARLTRYWSWALPWEGAGQTRDKGAFTRLCGDAWCSPGLPCVLPVLSAF